MFRRRFMIVLLVLLFLVAGLLSRFLLNRPPFDPVVVGKAEAGMWQAYYTGNQGRIAVYLVQLLRTQYGLTPLEAKRVGEQFAAAAMAFKSATGDYTAKVLPPLIDAYSRLGEATGSTFEPARVAEAELAWWVARRAGGPDSTEVVGRKIGELYATLHGEEHPAFQEAGLLRARAAHLRDVGGKNADWSEIQAMLIQSYTALARADSVGVP